MSHRRSLAAAGMLAAALLVPGIAVQAAPARSLSSPKAAALRPSDLPRGYKVLSAAFVSNARMAKNVKVAKAEFDKHGRLNGYVQTFQGNNPRSYVQVDAHIYLYRSAAGAHWDYSQSVAHDKRQFKSSTAPRIGTESSGLIYSVTAQGRHVVLYAVDFRKGAVDASVAVSGLSGYVTMNDAVHFARIIAGRIH